MYKMNGHCSIRTKKSIHLDHRTNKELLSLLKTLISKSLKAIYGVKITMSQKIL